MKKLLKGLLVVFMGVSIVACSGKNNDLTIEWGKENKLADIISFQVETASQTQQITPDVIGTYYKYYKPQTSTNVLLDVVLQVTNLKKEELKLSTAISSQFLIDDKEYKGHNISISEDGQSILQGATLAAEETKKVHFYTEIDPTVLDKEIAFKLASTDKDNEQAAVMTFKLSDVESHYESKKLKNVITFDGKAEVTLESKDVAKKIEPAKPTGLYTYYKVKADTNRFVIMKTKIKNISDKELKASQVMSAVLVDKDNHEYPCNMFFEKADQSNLSAASSATLEAGKDGTVYFVFEVSESIANEENTIRISQMGKVYTLKI
ncbi:DUF4352 domain-containing protein [Candidatus Stoquefichus massiliensis]|uniref:DUF4352 domain-containing protein n=1 Tax=Candidatus Stoquefichus massiliensis TaxID=1470350 RepID=UPI00048467EB|nr:DUF4352 domain-containing protein [Candidatus Stoquefichus massiliensis]